MYTLWPLNYQELTQRNYSGCEIPTQGFLANVTTNQETTVMGGGGKIEALSISGPSNSRTQNVICHDSYEEMKKQCECDP